MCDISRLDRLFSELVEIITRGYFMLLLLSYLGQLLFPLCELLLNIQDVLVGPCRGAMLEELRSRGRKLLALLCLFFDPGEVLEKLILTGKILLYNMSVSAGVILTAMGR